MRETPFTENSIIQDNVTVLHPVMLVVMIVAVFLILVLPRRQVLIPVIAAGILVPMQQSISIMTLDFRVLRILLLVALTRYFFLEGARRMRLVASDVLIICWMVIVTAASLLLWQSFSAIVNSAGVALDVLGIYFVTRFYVRDIRDCVCVVKTLAVVVCVLAMTMVVERLLLKNMFAMFGGLPEIVLHRSGRYRCQGPFMHPILAGTFGASLIPLFVIFIKQKRLGKAFGVTSCLASMTVAFTASSSGAIITLLASIGALFFWFFRRYLKDLRWATLVGLVALHFVMKDPVWALIGKFPLVSGSTGYHRFRLVDQFLRHFSEWWLVGTETTMHWGFMLYDITNQFVRIGIDGGLFSLILFIGLIYTTFHYVGRIIRANKNTKEIQLIAWAFGSCLFAQVVSFLGISFFDQTILLFYLMLGTIASLRETMAVHVPVRQHKHVEEFVLNEQTSSAT